MTSLNLKSKLNILNNITLLENIDLDKFKLLKNSSLLRSKFNNPSAKKWRNERNQLEAYEKLFNENKQAVILYQKTNNMTYGRSNPNNALGLFSFRKPIRHTLTENIYIDIDIVNCHPNLLNQVAKKNKISLKNLNTYITHRDYYLNKVMDNYNVSKDQAKELFIRILYYGSFENWIKDNNIESKEELPILKDFKKDIQKIGQLIYDNNKEIKKEVEKNKNDKNIYQYNKIGSVVSYYLQEIEVQILETIYLYCIDKGYIKDNTAVLCADGLMILKENYNDDLLNEFNEIIKSKFDFDLQFIKKDLDQGYSLKELEETQIVDFKFWDDLGKANQLFYAELYYNINPDKYKYSTISGWYEYNDFNILKNTGNNPPVSLLNNISKSLQEILKNEFIKLDPTNERYKDINKLYVNEYKKLGNSNNIEGIIKFLKQLYNDENIDENIDNNQNLLAFNNMLFDFTELQFRNIKPNDYISKTTNYNIDTEINEDIQLKIKNLLWSIFEDDEVIKYWSLTTASALFTNKFESLYLHVGAGGNGKGVLSNIIEKCLGSYFYTPPNTFLTSIYKGEAANSSLANCKGRRYVLITEPNNGENESKFNIDFISKLTGNDTITTREQYKTNVSFKPLFTIFVQCNTIPSLDKMHRAIQRRFKIINYPFNFVHEPSKPNERKGNENLKNEMLKDTHINQFMLYLLNTIKNNFDDENNYKDIIIPNICKETTNNYIDNNNPVKFFLNEYTEQSNNAKDRIKAKDLLNFFIDKGLVPMKESKFIDALKFNDITNIKVYSGYKTIYNMKFKEIIDDNKSDTNLFDKNNDLDI